MRIAIALFPRLTALDAVGPYEVLQRLPDTDVIFVGHRRGEIRTENGFLGLNVDVTFAELPAPDVLVVPGGIGTRALLEDAATLDWIRAAHAGSRYTTSVCTGSLLLAAAGLLTGLTAATHWTAMEELAGLGAVPSGQRVVEHLERRIITAAGVSSGIDMALRVAELLTDTITAKAQQLMIEYDPQPPFDAGDPATAGADVMARVLELSRLKD
jgi:putative intracellular protease/amidase